MTTTEVLPDEAATRALAARVAERLPRGALLLLEGPLGAGKTTFVAGLAQALRSTARTSSPTYTLVHEYPTPQGVLVHVDAYRLADPAALIGMGLDDYLERARAVVVEWGGPLAEDYPDAWRVRLERRNEASGRVAQVIRPDR